MKRVLKKFIAVICFVSVLSTAFVVPLVSTPVTVHAEPVGISMGLFEQVFGSLAGSFGMKSRSDSKYYGFPSVEELWNSFKQTYEMVRATKPEMLALTVDAWACSNLKDFIDGAIKVFPYFMQNLKAGEFDDKLTVDTPSGSYNQILNNLVSSKSLSYKVNDVNKFHSVKLDSGMVRVPTDGISSGRNYTLDYFINLSQSYNKNYTINKGFYIEDDRSTYPLINFFAIPANTGFFYFYDANSKIFTFYGDTLIMSNTKYNLDTGKTFQYNPTTQAVRNKSLQIYQEINDIRVIQMTNACIQMYTDGSFVLRDTNDMTKYCFDTIQDSLFDQISKSGTSIDDWELADENGKTIDDPENKILEKIYKNMLTAEDIEALRNGDTSVLDKLDGMTAVNSKTGETVGDIKDEVQDQTGILGGIKAIGRTIASRVLTIVNLIRNLHQRKWTAVIDNVGDLTLPLLKSIDGVRDVVNSLQSTKWVIDNVADLVNPITSSIDLVNGNVAGVISNVGNAILGAIDDIQTADLTSVVDGIKAVPKSIAQSLESAFEGVKSSVGAVSVAIGNLFAPPPVALSNIYTKGSDILDNHFCMPKAAFKSFMVEGKEVPDVKYKVGGKEYTVIPFSYFNKFVDKFRVYIQASFIFIWIVWFANQVLALFDKSAILSGHITDLGRGER